MNSLMELFANNRSWAEEARTQDPEFFNRLAQQQAPQYLWIGCSDSRVSANQLLGLPPGAVFVHRNVANIVAHGDLNCLSAMQYAVDVLKVKHVILCGHYGCGGVRAVQQQLHLGVIDNWLEHVHDVQCRHQTALQAMGDDQAWRALCELNVIDQLRNVRLSSVVQEAWARGQELWLHGWIYDIADGLLRDLKVTARDSAAFDTGYTPAIAAIRKSAGKE